MRTELPQDDDPNATEEERQVALAFVISIGLGLLVLWSLSPATPA